MRAGSFQDCHDGVRARCRISLGSTMSGIGAMGDGPAHHKLTEEAISTAFLRGEPERGVAL